MSEIVGSLGMELELKRDRFDREVQSLRNLKDGQIRFAASLDTRALRRQVENLSKLNPKISATVAVSNLNAVEGQLRTLTRDRQINVGIRLDDRAVSQQLQALTQSRVIRLQAALINSTAIENQIASLTRDRIIKIGFEFDDKGVFQKLSKYSDKTFKVTAQVDDSRLTALNKHLDLKQKHFGQVNNYFKSSPLTPRTDLTHLDVLEKRLDAFKNSSIEIGVNVANVRSQIADLKAQLASIEIPVNIRNASASATQSVTQKVTADTSAIEKNVTQALNNSFQGLEKTVTNAFSKIGKGNVLGGIGDVLTAPLKLAANAASGILSGVGLGIGQEISKDLGKGISEGIDAELAPLIGSFRLVGKQAASALTGELIASLGQDGQLVQKILEDLVGKDNILIESGATRSKQRKRQQQRTVEATRFFQTEAQSTDRGAIRAEATKLSQQQADVEKIRANIAEKTASVADRMGGSRIKDRISKVSADLQSAIDNQNTRLVEQLSTELTQLGESLAEINRSAATFFQAEIDQVNSIQDKLATARQRLERKLQPFEAIETLGTIQAPAEVNQSIQSRRKSIAGLQDKQARLKTGSVRDAESLKSARQLRDQQLANPERDEAALAKINQLIESLQSRQAQRVKLYQSVSEQLAKEESQLQSLIAQSQQPLAVQAQTDELSSTLAGLFQQLAKVEELAQKATNEQTKAFVDRQREQIQSAISTTQQQLALLGANPGKAKAPQPVAPKSPVQQSAAPKPTQPASQVTSQPTSQSVPESEARPLPPTIRKILGEVAAISGVEVPENLVPKFNVSDQIKGTGQYDPGTNTLNISAEIAKQLATSGFSEEITAVIVHELRHAIQSGFGQVDSFKNPAIGLIRPTESELENAPVVRGRTLQQRIDGSTQLAQQRNPGKEALVRKVVEPLEADAYAFENRYASQVYRNVFNPPDAIPDPWADSAPIQKVEPVQQQTKQRKGLDITVDMDRLGDIAYQAGATIQAVSNTGKKVASVFRVMANSEAGQAFIGGVGNATRSFVAIAKTGYKVASAMESLALDMVPMGRTTKGILQQTAVPALAFGAATQFLPGGQIAAEGLNQLVGGAIAPFAQSATGAATGAATNFIQSVVPNFMGMQGAVGNAVTGMIQSGSATVTEMIVQAGTVILGGKVLTGVAGNAMKSALPPSQQNALPPSQTRALPQATIETQPVETIAALPPAPTPKVTPQAEIVQNPFEGLTRPQMLAASRKLGIQGVNSKTTKGDLEARLKSYRDQGEVDRVLEQVRAEIGKDGKPIAGVDKKAESAAIKKLAAAEKSINKKISALATATGKKRETLINEILAGTQSAIAEIDQLKGQNLSGETIRSLSGIQGRLENSYRNNPTLNDARNERIQTARSAAIQSANQRNITGLARVTAPAEAETATLGRTLKEGVRKLTNFTAKQFDVIPQPTIKGTLGAIAKSPRAKDLATDLAVNTAGFAASKLGEQYGIVPGLAGDLMGALAMRQVIARGRPSGKDLTGDLAGFAIGNGFASAANAGLDALSGVVPGAGLLKSIPLKGAIAAMATVPKVQQATEKFQQPQGLARVSSGGLIEKFKSLLPSNQKKSDQLKANYEAIYREIAKLSGAAFDPKNLPKLSIDANRLKAMGAEAFYDLEKNTIVIDESLARILSGRAGMLRRNADKIAGLVHEGRHSVQLDQGRLSLEQAASGQGVSLMDGRNLTRSQRQQVEASVGVARASGASAGQLNAAKALETDAYAFEANTGQILARVTGERRSLLQRLTQAFSRLTGQVSPEITARLEQLDRSVSTAVDQRVQSQIKEIESQIELGAIQPEGRTPRAAQRVKRERRKVGLTPAQQRDLDNLETQVNVQSFDNDLPVESLRSAARFDAAAERIRVRSDRTFERARTGERPGVRERARNLRQDLAPEAAEYFKAAQRGLQQLGIAPDKASEAFGRVKEALPGLNNGLKFLIGNAGLAVKGFLGFTVLSNILPQIQNFAAESLKAAIALDKVRTALNFSTGGKAADALKTVGTEAERLGIPLQSAQAGYSKLLASTRGTAVQGRASEDLFKGLNSAATVLGLGDEEYSGSILALSQIASKGKVQAEELRGQLGERVPGAFGIAARSLNISEGELNKRLEQGSVTAEEFLPKFARQLQVEFGGAAESASGGTQASLNKLQNSVLKTQQSLGALFTPAVSAGANALSGIIELLANNLDKVAIAALALTVRMTGIGALNLSGAIQQVLGLGNTISVASVKAAAFQALKFAGTIALIAAAVESVRSIGEVFALDEAGKQFEQFGNAGEASLKRIEEAAKRARGEISNVSPKPKTESKGFDLTLGAGKALGLGTVTTDDYLKFARELPGFKQIREGVSSATGGRFTPGTTVGELQQQRRSEEFQSFVGTGNELLGQAFNTGNARDILSRTSQFDNQITAQQNERNRLAAQPKTDRNAIAQADAEIKRLSEERSKITAPLTELQSGLQQQLSNARTALERTDLTGEERQSLQAQIANIEKAQGALGKLQNQFSTSADRVRELSIALAEMGMELEAVQRNAEIKFNINSRDELKARIANFGRDENASLNAGVSTAQLQAKRSQEQLVGTQRVLDNIKPKLETPEAKQVLESIVNPTTGKALSTDSSIEEIQRAKAGLSDSDPRKKQLDDLIEYKKALAELPNQERQVEADRLAVLEANQQKRLGLVEKEAAKRDLSNRKSLNAEQIALVRKQQNKSISEEDAAIESAKLASKQTDADLSNTQTQLQELNAAFNEGTISAEQFAQKRIELEGKVSDLTLKKAQDELSIREAINRKVLEGFERRNKIAAARIDASSSDAIANIRTTQLNGGLVGEGGQTEIAKVELSTTQQRIGLKQQELAEVKKLRDQRVLSEKEAADRTLAIEAELRDARSRIIDLQTQEVLRGIQKEVDAQKRASDAKIAALDREKVAIESTISLLDAKLKRNELDQQLSQATSGLRQTSLKGGLDRASEASSLQQQLSGAGQNEKAVIQNQLSELGYNGSNQVQILQQRQAIQAEMDQERINALRTQQELEKQSLALSFQKEKQQAKINLLERRSAVFKAEQNVLIAQGDLRKAQKTGDVNDIQNAAAIVDVNQKILEGSRQQLASQAELNGFLDEEFRKRQQISDLQQQTALDAAQQEADANRRKGQLEVAKAKDQFGGGVGGSMLNTGTLSGGMSGGGGSSGIGGGGRSISLFGEDIAASRRGSGDVEYAIKNAFGGRKGQEEAVLRAIQGLSGKDRDFAVMAAQDRGFGDIVNMVNKIDNAQSSASPNAASSLNSAVIDARMSGDVVGAIKSLGDRIDNLAKRPSNVSISTPDPISDYAKYRNEEAGRTLGSF
ncbi:MULTISPECIES: tape measure protein [Leptolyngbya]|jgi:tape measure domain-containing protein|uniref:tape measure protein n=1 Tax=Leptolyngbya TaxID=47251 RepID=UPI000366F004|nr:MULTISPECIES: tape measure protein [Leptolyngbya]MBD2368854.1 tape measure protein [Leptolyngbya sp. FACHB-161]MBD2375278.1 tape measure protein [Leptolyngbya sp. FACHB-238]MBD2399696.1 tape measure protein [Leptolyngbya sp. FACHB-239]MBD2405902.1 tape measure protein [Leptolyngbya sp. FACHB-402]ULP32722.1 tape measure protein [Leptolyngbya boryana IU 594]